MPKQANEKTQVVTANHLLSGHVVYLTATRRWANALEEAEIHNDTELARAALQWAEGRADEVVGAYLADIDLQDGRVTTTHFREEFRRTGPSNYFHGKQAEIANVSL